MVENELAQRLVAHPGKPDGTALEHYFAVGEESVAEKQCLQTYVIVVDIAGIVKDVGKVALVVVD